MKRYSSAAGLALAIVVVMGLAGPAAAQVQVPFKGYVAGIDSATPLAPPLMSAQVTTIGSATLLGKCTFTEQLTINSATRFGSGTFLFTAADGSTVYGTSSGQATFTPPNILNIVESGIIMGGTGRFAGAKGSFAVLRVKNTITGATSATFSGTISVPGAGN